MSRCPRAALWGLCVALLAGGLAERAVAAGPVTVSVEGVVLAEGQGSVRDRALNEAIVAAALEASLRFLPVSRFEVPEELERLREALRGTASRFVLTYRVDGPVFTRPRIDEPEVLETVLPLTATLDGGRLREYLREQGWLEAPADRPSIALRVAPESGLEPDLAAGPLGGFEQFLLRSLEASGFVVMEPRMSPYGLEEGSALALARSLGADLALEVGVSWRDRVAQARVVGGVADVEVRALRADDGVEIARSRFEAPAYHDDREEALVRALQALGDQVAQNLELQLERNWQTLARGQGPVELRLLELQSLLQANAVRDALTATLDAERVELLALGPGSAELRVAIALSPGALQDRLTAVAFEGFRLEPLRTTRDRVELRVQPIEPPEPAERPAASP